MTGWRVATLTEVKTDLWRYLSTAARPEAIEASAEGLWDLDPGSVRRLVAIHHLLSDSTIHMLEETDWMLGHMAARARHVSDELVGMLYGSIDWTLTQQIQLNSGDSTRFICLIPDRHFDTPLGRLIAFNLQACQMLIDAAVIRGGNSSIRDYIEDIRIRCHRLSRHVKLAGVKPVLPNMRQLAALMQRGHIRSMVEFARTFADGFQGHNPQVIRRVIEEQLLAPATDDTLFELLVGVRLAREFECLGYKPSSRALIEPGSKHPLIALQREADRVRIWWQRATNSILELGEGLYVQALRSANLPASSLRPDLVIEFVSTGRAVLVEVKFTTRAVSPTHQGIKDVLLYLMDSRGFFDAQPFPHGVVAAFAAEQGSVHGRVVLTSGESADLANVVTQLIRVHGSPN